MLRLGDVQRITGARRVDLVTWIEERWVLPVREGDDYRFSDADIARVRLILELRRDLRIGADALPVVLDLLDRVYAMRRALRDIGTILQDLPEAERRRIHEKLAGRSIAGG
jgi:chaperone modulatory protein CbpM